MEHETQDVRRWWEHLALLRRLGDGVLVGGPRVWVLILLRLGCLTLSCLTSVTLWLRLVGLRSLVTDSHRSP